MSDYDPLKELLNLEFGVNVTTIAIMNATNIAIIIATDTAIAIFFLKFHRILHVINVTIVE